MTKSIREKVKEAQKDIIKAHIQTYKTLKNKPSLTDKENYTLYKLEKWVNEKNIKID